MVSQPTFCLLEMIFNNLRKKQNKTKQDQSASKEFDRVKTHFFLHSILHQKAVNVSFMNE